MSKLGFVIPQILQFILHTVDFRQPLVSRQNRHVSIFSHHQFRSWLHRKVLELDFTHVVSHVKSTLAVSLLVVSKTQPFSVCVFHTVNILWGPFSSQLPIDWVFGWVQEYIYIPNICCVFVIRTLMVGHRRSQHSPSARSRAATPRERGIACPFVSPLNRVFPLPRIRPR